MVDRSSAKQEEQEAEADARALRRGRGPMLVVMIGIASLSILGFAWYLIQDQPNQHAELGKQINGLRAQYFDAFWSCALPGKRLTELKSDADLRAELRERAASGSRYAQHLTSACAPHTRELLVRLRVLMPPADAKQALAQMTAALMKMDTGTRVLGDFLADSPRADEDAFDRASQELVRGWYEFRRAHGQLNQTVRERLGR